ARSFVWALLGLALVGACKPKPPEPPLADDVALKVPLAVRASEDSNEGRPVHVVVRGLARADFIEDGYATVAKLVISPDETVVARLVVFPGKMYVLDLAFAEVPETIGVYGLFTKVTGESWKVAFEGAEFEGEGKLET